jgi:hypothetical protein
MCYRHVIDRVMILLACVAVVVAVVLLWSLLS